MNKAFFYDIINRNQDFFSAIASFNQKKLQSLIDDVLPNETIEALSEYICFNALDAKILDKYTEQYSCSRKAGKKAGYWDFADETKRLILLPPETIKTLALVFSASVHAREIATSVKKKEVLALREQLGQDIYSYTILRGQFRLGSIKNSFFDKDKDTPLAKRIKNHAEDGLFIIASPWQTELKELFCAHIKEQMPELAMRLHKTIRSAEQEENTQEKDEFDELRPYIWFSFKKLLLKEVNKAWLHYFN